MTVNDIFASDLFNAINIEKGLEEARKRIAAERTVTATFTKAHDIRDGKGGRFNTLSLDAWLTIADLAGVAFVPARKVVEMPADLPRHLDEGKILDEADSAAFDRIRDVSQALGSDEMLRADYSATGGIKYMLSEGAGWQGAGRNRGVCENADGTAIFDLLDPRLVELELEYASDIIPIFVRPWIQAASRPGTTPYSGKPGIWPVEWRVFVENMTVIGVSNYYPQAPAGEDEIAKAREAVALGSRIADLVKARGLKPTSASWSEGMQAHAEAGCFTLDFLQTPDGDLMLIEGGPGFGLGAHPCCFARDEGPSFVKGIALAPVETGGAVLPLAI